ncbi:NAD(P)/FAD-dependent oxidoreductase [Streptomyces sp. NPDC006332]|uniref:NAD(P)/FAD-dependent oxidoreductase n=1 Tax=Streptomyces sp. NPDC006332 TaxID=3155456 RepID=UPI0033B69E9F
MTPIESDLLVVGAGPVGLFAAYYAGFRGLSTAIVDSLSEPGGQVTALYPEKPIYDIAGFPSVRGRTLVENLMEQAAPFDPTYVLAECATELSPQTDGTLHVRTDAGTTFRTRAVVITAGIGTFTPRPLEAGQHLVGSGVSYFVPDPELHRDQHVVVVGGGDSACDWALALEPIARTVTLVHRRAAFRAHTHTVSQLTRSTVDVITDAQITKVHGDSRVQSVTITGADATQTEREADAVIAALGFKANLGPLRTWGLQLADNRYLRVDAAMRTTMPGVFAAGDITDYGGKVRLLAVGFGEAATAVNHAAVHINPEETVFPGHSTDTPAGPAEETT